MEFSFDRFYQLNRKAIIWVVLFGLIYFLWDFFTLIFLTFILSFFAFPASQYLTRRLHLPKSLSVILVYLAFLSGYLALYVLVLPNVVNQATSMRGNLPRIQEKLNELRITYTAKYPNAAGLFNFDVESPFLNKDEILDWPHFVRELADPNAGRVVSRVQERLPSELLAEVRKLKGPAPSSSTGNFLSPTGTLNEEPAPASPEGASTAVGAIPLALQERIVAAINEHVIDSRDFARSEDFTPFAEELGEKFSEIRTALDQRGWQGLSDRDVQKLNRHLLETAFGGSEPPLILEQNYQTEKKINQWIVTGREKLQEYLPNIALYLLRFLGNSLLAILFSFLIVFDYARLSKEVKILARSKLSDFFAEAGQPVVNFAISVGRGFEAIVLIAFITTLLVVPTLIILGIPSIAFLAVVTFVTSLVPVIGIIFEMIPVALVALNEHGPERALWAVIALAIIHIIIGYVITPIIFGRQFKLNVVAVLFILFIGHQVAGVWGMILGVPVANYLLRDVFGVPSLEEKQRSAKPEESEDDRATLSEIPSEAPAPPADDR